MALVTQSGFLGGMHKQINELKADNTALQMEMIRYQKLYNRVKEAYEYVANLADNGNLMKPEHHARIKTILSGQDNNKPADP